MIGKRLQVFAILIALSPLAVSADSLKGTVTNGTTKKPSAGDDVTLIKLQQGMQEAAHAKTDAKGRFTLDLPDPGMHLVRITHDKANYFRAAPPGTKTVEIEVYDAAEMVEGVNIEADVRRYETDGNGLKVLENFFVQNQSSPPRTQFGMHAFEFYLPENAKIEGSAALGPGGMPVQSPPVPTAEKGRYAFPFPIRPGETRFQVSYHLDYTGKLKLIPRLVNPTANFAVMLPKAMQFKGGPSTTYASIDDDPNAQTFLARNVAPSQPLEFELSGSGQMPREAQGNEKGGTPGQQDSSATAQGSMPATAATDARPGGGIGIPGDSPDPLKKYLWWIVAGVSILFVGAAAMLMRKPLDAVGAPSAAGAPLATTPFSRSGSSGALLNALKEELFAIETERLEGKLNEQEYSEQKGALEIVLRRALSRQRNIGNFA